MSLHPSPLHSPLGLSNSLFRSELSLLDNPQVLSHLSQVYSKDFPPSSLDRQQINLQQLLLKHRGPSVKRINDNRQRYREIKEKIVKCMSSLKGQNYLSIGELLQWKQTILSSFLNQFLVQISHECKEKSQILVYIWNTVFNVVEYLLETVSRMGQQEQKQHLQSLLHNHVSYQGVIEGLQARLAKKEKERLRQEEFIKALIYNLRFKRKEIKKLAKNMKLCTVKLNELKDFYLDLQLEHIELLSQNRDISKENALNLLKRKQQINHQKRKEYRLKQSHRRIRFQIQNQIEIQNENQGENVNKLNDQLQAAFFKYYDGSRSMGDIESAAQNIFQNALDDFTVRIDDIPETETIIDFKSNVAFTDAATDMTDFEGDTEDKQVQITFVDRLREDMIHNIAMQTVEIKPKSKVYEECAIQAQEIELRSLKLNRFRVIDRSYILQDYRGKDRRFKLDRKTTLKTKTEQYLKSMRQIHYYDNNKKTVELLDYQLESDAEAAAESNGLNCVNVQTEEACILNFSNIPSKLRNPDFEKEVHRYVQRAKRLSIAVDNQQAFEEGYARSLKTRGFTKRSLHRNINSITMHETDPRNKSLPGSFHTNTDKEPSFRTFKHHDSPTSRKPSKRSKQLIWEIKEQGGHGEPQGRNKQASKKKTEHSKDRQKFLQNLNLGDKFLTRHRFEGSQQNKKLLLQLQRLSEELTSNKNLVELLQSNIDQNMHILREELRKMLQRKKNNRKLPLSRQKALTKVISLVLTYAYHLYFNHDRPLISLIVPLFHYFKIGYGEIKKNDLYLRMLYFLSQTVCHKEEYSIFQTFILFLGLDLDGNRLKIGKENTCLFLRLLNCLSLNFRFPLNVQQLYTTPAHLDTKCREVLLQQKYQPALVQRVVERTKAKLQSLMNQGESGPTEGIEYGEVKINVFKCCQFIIEQLEKVKTAVYDSYALVYQHFLSVEGLNKDMFYRYVIRNLYIGRHEQMAKLRAVESALQGEQSLSQEGYLYKIVGVFLQLNIVDFNKVYFSALAKYRIKQEFLFLSISRRYAFLVKYVELHGQEFVFERNLIECLLHREENNLGKDLVNKKIMGLAYLQVVENQTQRLLNTLMGDSLATLYSIDII